MMNKAGGNHPRQLLIGLDAMEWTLVERWAAAGKLPTFRRLIESGSRAVLASTAGQLPDTIWACTFTGLNPAKFEKYFYVQYDPHTQRLRHLTDDAIAPPAFWDYLSEAGVRVGVADAPKFKLSKCIDAGGGFQLANWGTHASTTARASTPSNLLNEVQTRFGTHAVGECDAVDHHPRALCRLRRNVVTGVNQHGEVFRWLMRERQWDVFLAGFSASHCIGHHFWHGTDESHPRYDEAVAAGIDGAIEEVYCAIDRELGELIAAAGPHAQVMVFSAHGMGPLYHASWNLPEIIDLLGYGRQAPRKRERNESRDAKVNPWRILKTTLPGALQYRIKAMLPKAMQDQLLFLWYSGGRQWAGSRAFAVPNNDAVGSIRLAVKGRDKYGLIEPGEEYRRVRNDIADALYGLTDPVSGRPVIKRVAYVHDEYKGPFANQLPDLTVLWDQSFAWSSLHSQRIGTLRIRAQDARTGGHTAYGFLLATGPHVACGARIYGGSLYDIAPTVLETAGVAAPRDLDGRALRLQSAEAHT